jgi:hypothetical protein
MRLIRTLLSLLVSAVVSALVAGGVAYVAVIRPRLKEWGVDPGEAQLPVPGDDLVAEPSAVETRGITIEAPPAAVWPWLVQMGYERAGWYSYDAMDQKGRSADAILPEFQQLAVGDIMPTHPGGGFRVEVVEPKRALVLYSDTELVREQARQAEEQGRTELPTPGLKVSGAMTGAAFPEFAASWAFYLKPIEGGSKTRLIERFRARTPGGGAANVVLGEIMGTGIVLMQRKQMIGIKERVEGTRRAEPESLETVPAEAPVA